MASHITSDAHRYNLKNKNNTGCMCMGLQSHHWLKPMGHHYDPLLTQAYICTVAVLIKLIVELQMLFSSVLDNNYYVKCFIILKPLNT